MRKAICLVLLLSAVGFGKTAIDLMNEGRFSEAKAILDSTQAAPRYSLLLMAMTEPDAVRACSLYTSVTERFPDSDCADVARERLALAKEMGVGKSRTAAAQPEPEMIAGRGNDKSSEVILSDARESKKSNKKSETTAPETKEHAAPAETKAKESGSNAAATLPKPEDSSVKTERTKIASTGEPTEKPVAESRHRTKADKKVDKLATEATTTPKVETKPLADGPKEVAATNAKPAPAESKSVSKTTETTKQPPTGQAEAASKPASEPAANPVEKTAPPVPPKPEPKSKKANAETAKPVVEKQEVAKPSPEPAKNTAAPVVTETKPATPESKPEPKAKAAAPKVEAPVPAKPEPKSVEPTKHEPKPEPKSERVESANLSAHPGSWFIQVGAFGNHDNARKLAASLEAAGYGVKLVPRSQGDKELLQVRVGGYASKEACQEVAPAIKSKFSVPAVIVTE